MIGNCQRDKQINRKLWITKVGKFEYKEKSVILFLKNKLKKDKCHVIISLNKCLNKWEEYANLSCIRIPNSLWR